MMRSTRLARLYATHNDLLRQREAIEGRIEESARRIAAEECNGEPASTGWRARQAKDATGS